MQRFYVDGHNITTNTGDPYLVPSYEVPQEDSNSSKKGKLEEKIDIDLP